MKPVVQRVRELVLAADPRIDECIKWQAPTFTYLGNLASFFPKSKQHASLMFHLGAQTREARAARRHRRREPRAEARHRRRRQRREGRPHEAGARVVRLA